MYSETICKSAIIAALLTLAACAISPEAEQRRKDMEADIDEILSYELDKSEYGEPKDCLSKSEYRSFRALGDRHLLFEGRKDKLWVNVLRGGRCFGLDDNSAFIIEPTSATRSCEMDQFEVVDRANMGTGTALGITCVLGEFKPLARAQLEEIEARLEAR